MESGQRLDATLEFDAEGLTLTVTARFQTGTDEIDAVQAGHWFAARWQEAQQACFVQVVQHALTEAPAAILTRQGKRFWSSNHRQERLPAVTAAEASPASAPVEERGVTVPIPPPLAPIQRYEDVPAEAHEAIPNGVDHRQKTPPNNGPERRGRGRPPKPERRGRPSLDEHGNPRDRDAINRKILKTIADAGRPMTVSELIRVTGLSNYDVRAGVKKLGEQGHLHEEKWGAQYAYTST